jgi:glucose-1-phosphate adenylyltransferase
VNSVHGLIYAYHAFPELRELGLHRTGAALPFCGRYRLIDFALSGMMRAGVRDVGVIMQRGYLSLMEHLGSGRSWNLASHAGGLHLLPPFGLADAREGVYSGCMDALSAVYTYLRDSIRQDYVLITRGDLCANLDMRALIERHAASGADVTAVCREGVLPYPHHRFLIGADGLATELLCQQTTDARGLASLETYILRRERLLELVAWCREGNRLHFHRDALLHALRGGWRIDCMVHGGYGLHLVTAQDYYPANLDMLDGEARPSLLPPEPPVATRARSDTSSYYGAGARVSNSLIADGCYIEGCVENSVLFGGVRVGADATVRDCIILNDTHIGEGADLRCVISDKNARVSPYLTLAGNASLPLLIPKGSKL